MVRIENADMREVLKRLAKQHESNDAAMVDAMLAHIEHCERRRRGQSGAYIAMAESLYLNTGARE